MTLLLPVCFIINFVSESQTPEIFFQFTFFSIFHLKYRPETNPLLFYFIFASFCNNSNNGFKSAPTLFYVMLPAPFSTRTREVGTQNSTQTTQKC